MGSVEKMAQYAVGIAEDDSHGYSQVRRWKSQGTDRDCSSLMIEAAHEAGYDVPTGYGYTGSMLSTFKAAGFEAILFSRVGLAGLKRGDILLNVEHHTEMYIGGGRFVGAHCAENGGIDGRPGDQTGDEISICAAYVPSYGWDYVLRPPADGSGGSAKPAPKVPKRGKALRFKLSTDPLGVKWLAEGRYGVRGAAIRWVAIDGAKRYRVCTTANGWLPYVSASNVLDLEDGCAGDGSPITAVEVDDDGVMYAARAMGKANYYAWMVGRTSTDGDSDHFAGDMANAIDGFKAFHAVT